MNTRPRFRLATRAEFSPVRVSRNGQNAPATEPANGLDRVIRLERVPDLPRWPAWHRSALDRLQPDLTRYRE